MSQGDQSGEKIKVGVSSCLIGEKVRYNGEHTKNMFVSEILGKFFEWVPICPEVEVGMGIPRETVGLYGLPDNPKMLGKKSKTDWTRRMRAYSEKRVKRADVNNLCGYIFKSRSPSCGLARIPIYKEPGSESMRRGRGLFADAFLNQNPLVPVEEEGRLNDMKIRENFIVRVFSFHRLQGLLKRGVTRGDLVKFHTDSKFLLLAHSRNQYKILGQLVANMKKMNWSEARQAYIANFMKALTYTSTPKKNTDVLLHMMGFFKKELTGEEKRHILENIDDYRNEQIPLIVPLTLIQHYVRKLNVDYLKDQIYLNPHPKELMLRNHV